MLRKIILFVYIFGVICFVSAAHAQTQSGSLVHDGQEREYLLHIPTAGLQNPAPLVIALHGGGGTAANFRAESNFDAVADTYGFIVVYPQGISREWNERRGSGFTLRRSNADDVGYINALIDYLSAAYPIDPARIYAAGISNGGFMAIRLACDLNHRIAGIGVVAAQFTEDMLADCEADSPLRVAIMNGTDDPLIPYDGGAVFIGEQYRGDVLPTETQLNYWLNLNDCNPSPTTTITLNNRPLDATSVEIVDYARCTPGGGVRLYRIIGGGHTLPNGNQYLPRVVIGEVSREIDAALELWQFWALFAME